MSHPLFPASLPRSAAVPGPEAAPIFAAFAGWLGVRGAKVVARTEALATSAASDFGAARRSERVAGARLTEELRAELGDENTWLSRSNSAGWILAAGYSFGGEASADRPERGFGVDLELAARPVSNAVVARMARPAELEFGLKAIELWTLKEAAYKANPESSGTWVTQYEVISVVVGARGIRTVAIRGPSGRIQESLLLCAGAGLPETSAWVVAFALG